MVVLHYLYRARLRLVEERRTNRVIVSTLALEGQ
jgi:hypothetical protein